MSYDILKPNLEAHHPDAKKKGSANTKCGKGKKLSAYIGTKPCKRTREKKCNALSYLD